MHGSSDHITCAGDALSSDFYAAARFMGMEYLSGLKPTDNAQRVFNRLVRWAERSHMRPAAWIVLLAMSIAYARRIGEEMPEAWWIAGAGSLPIDAANFDSLVSAARRELDYFAPTTMP
jgi:hypothetical protein